MKTEPWDYPPPPRYRRQFIDIDDNVPLRRTSFWGTRAGSRTADFVFRCGLGIFKFAAICVLTVVMIGALVLLIALAKSI
jgi:hypothetical protein